LTARFERYTGQAIGIEKQDSKSLAGVSTVRNFFNSSADLNTAIAQTTSLVLSVLRKLPPGTQPPLILPFDPMAAMPLALVAVSGDVPEKKLVEIARYQVRNTVQSVNGAMAPTLMGGVERQVIIYLNEKRWRATISHRWTFCPKPLNSIHLFRAATSRSAPTITRF
jgi:multidrug efflux pump subunit AcrB